MFNQWLTGVRGGWLTLVVVAVLAVGGGLALAATTTSSGAIHACAAKRGGALRLARSCKKNERAISWNVQGIAGKNGSNGTNGINGTPGTNGGPGAVVLTRVRSTGATASTTATTNSVGTACAIGPCPDPAHGAAVSLARNGWTQGANQINQFVGQATVTPPNQSACTFYSATFMGTLPGSMLGEIEDAATGGVLAYFTGPGASSTPSPTTVPLTVSPLFEPGSTVNHALIVKIADNCGAGGNGAVGGGHFTLNSFALDPIGIS